MKDELGSGVMSNFVALRSKAYAYGELLGGEPKKCKEKCIKKCVIRETLKYDDYKRFLFDRKDVYGKQITFKRNLHEVSTIETNKLLST